MTRVAPWLLLAATTLYRHTWGRCDCPALTRRLNVAHRETRDWQSEARLWCTRYYELKESM